MCDLKEIPMTSTPCKSCLKAVREINMRVEAVQPLPEGAWAPIGLNGIPQCFDCASAGTLMRFEDLTWEQSRIAVANDRQEQYRLPGTPMGLVYSGIVQQSKEGDLPLHHDWLRKIGLMEEENIDGTLAGG